MSKNKNINQFIGNGNIINQNQYNINNEKISDKYDAAKYCLRKKLLKSWGVLAITALSVIVDLIELKNALLPSLFNMFAIQNPNRTWSYIKFIITSSLFLIILFFIKECILCIVETVICKKIYKNYYKSDRIYKLIPQSCPLCNNKIIITEKNNIVTFNCVYDESHSKKIAFSELDKLPFE